MADPFVGEIRMFGGNFAPQGWALCNGQLLQISQNTALFSLLGTTYGGDGRATFALPDLQGRLPVHFGQGPGLSNHELGEATGEETVILTVNEMPAHRHSISSAAAATRDTPAGNVFGSPGAGTPIYGGAANAALSPVANSVVGGGQAHPNLMPFLCTTFIIALQGIFPARS